MSRLKEKPSFPDTVNLHADGRMESYEKKNLGKKGLNGKYH